MITLSSVTVPTQPDLAAKPRASQRGFWTTMLVKELRETGYIAAVIMSACLAFVVLLSQFFLQTGWLKHVEVTRTGGALFCSMVPLMTVLTCGSATFAMERENRTIAFLRALPISPMQIFWTKVFVLAMITVSSCLIFWPIAIFGIDFLFLVVQPLDQSSHLFLVTDRLIFLGEAFLWAILFSLREKKVLYAVIKSSIGFFFVSLGPRFVAMANVDNHGLDNALDRLDLLVRISAAVFIVGCIAVLARTWMRDRKNTFVLSGLFNWKRTIQADRVRAFSSIRRQAWLQFRTVGFPFVVFAILFASVTFMMGVSSLNGYILYKSNSVVENQSPKEFRESLKFRNAPDYRVNWFQQGSRTPEYLSPAAFQIYWMISASLMGMIACKGVLDTIRFVVLSGYSPRRIWLVHTTIALLFCQAIALLIAFCAFRYIVFDLDLKLLFVGFAIGQVVAVFFRTMVLACILAGLSAALGWLFCQGSETLFVNQFPTFFLLAILPMGLVALSMHSLGTQGRINKRLFKFILVACIAALIPFPLLRIYEVPDANVGQILTSYEPSSDSRTHETSLADTKRVADTLEEIYRARDNHVIDYKQLPNELENAYRPLLASNASLRLLLDSSADDLRNLKRLKLIHLAHDRVYGNAGAYKRQGYSGHTYINRMVLNRLNWTLTFDDSSLLFWWATHPRTQAADIKSIIKRLENESEVFETVRAYRVADFRYSTELPRSDPEFLANISYGPYFLRHCITWMPWEHERYKRNARNALRRDWQTISDIESMHRNPERVVPLKKTVPTHFTDRICKHLTHFSVPGPAQISTILNERRATRVYLAIVLWQKQHGGKPPESLTNLVPDYLECLPVSPFDGSSFYFDAGGFSEGEIDYGLGAKHVEDQWSPYRLYGVSDNSTLVGHPILWTNIPKSTTTFRRVGTDNLLKTKAELVSSRSFSFKSRIWFLPKPESLAN